VLFIHRHTCREFATGYTVDFQFEIVQCTVINWLLVIFGMHVKYFHIVLYRIIMIIIII